MVNLRVGEVSYLGKRALQAVWLFDQRARLDPVNQLLNLRLAQRCRSCAREFPSGEAERSTPDKESAQAANRKEVAMSDITAGPLPRQNGTVNGYELTRDYSHDRQRAARLAVDLVRGRVSLTNLTHRQAMALPGVTPTEYWRAYWAAKKNGG